MQGASVRRPAPSSCRLGFGVFFFVFSPVKTGLQFSSLCSVCFSFPFCFYCFHCFYCFLGFYFPLQISSVFLVCFSVPLQCSKQASASFGLRFSVKARSCGGALCCESSAGFGLARLPLSMSAVSKAVVLKIWIRLWID